MAEINNWTCYNVTTKNVTIKVFSIVSTFAYRVNNIITDKPKRMVLIGVSEFFTKRMDIPLSRLFHRFLRIPRGIRAVGGLLGEYERVCRAPHGILNYIIVIYARIKLLSAIIWMTGTAARDLHHNNNNIISYTV